MATSAGPAAGPAAARSAGAPGKIPAALATARGVGRPAGSTRGVSESDEEATDAERADKFLKWLALEAEAEQRQTLAEHEQQGVLGITFTCAPPHESRWTSFYSNKGHKVKIADMIDAALQCLRSHDGISSLDTVGGKAFGDRVAAILVFIDHVLHLYFRQSIRAPRILGRIASVFMRQNGICHILQDALNPDESKKVKIGGKEVHAGGKRELQALLREALTCLKNVLEELVPSDDSEESSRMCEQLEEFVFPKSANSAKGARQEGPAWITRPMPARILKTTPVTMSRCLWELRERYRSDDFQKKYQSIREKTMPGDPALIDCALAVQRTVLPSYGFAPSIDGVAEMRKEVVHHIKFCDDDVVHKLQLDIHQLLEVGQPLPLLAGQSASCDEAARRISTADVLLVCAGAGFSADSGLAVYADVARVTAYAARNLDYADLCDPSWLSKDPELFWGFWGQCQNDYRETAPHEGYEIIARWVDHRFRSSSVAEDVRQKQSDMATTQCQAENTESLLLESSSEVGSGGAAGIGPYDVTGHAGACFVFTSNVDTHFFDWFEACEIRECHGNAELYQCADGEHSERSACRNTVWRAPLDVHFQVDVETMLAPREVGEAQTCRSQESAAPPTTAPSVGRVRGGGRPRLLRNMPATGPAPAPRRPRLQHPACPSCSGAARPAVLMFEDTKWLDVRSQEQRWARWTKAVKDLIADRANGKANAALRVVILEVGAGGRVTTVRKTSEQHLLEFHQLGAEVRLIRVNPELPLADCRELAPDGPLGHLVISIMSKGLQALQQMDAAMPPTMR